MGPDLPLIAQNAEESADLRIFSWAAYALIGTHAYFLR
jgi:hypothetical protein